MPVTLRSRVAVCSIFAGLLLAPSGARAADVKAACVAASTEGQSLRDAGKLKAAREQFVSCARDQCPTVVRKYCADWLSDVERRLPSIVLRAQTSDGRDVADAHVILDGQPLAAGLGGTAIVVDPGAHDVRYEREGAPPIDEHVVIVEGEKGRVVTGRFPLPAPPPEPTPAPEPPPPQPAISPLTIVLGAVGVVGIAGFTYFGLSAKGDVDHLRGTCAPLCATSDVDAAKREALVADVALGVGVVALGAAAYTLLARPREARPGAAVIDLRPIRGGAFAGVGARF